MSLSIPDDFDLPARADVKRRLAEAVSVLARTPYATWPDLREQLGLPADSSSFKKLMNDYLPRYDLAVTTVTKVFRKRNRLGLIRLTERGKTLARRLGIEPVENHWERVIRRHQGEAQFDHTGLLLAVERQARRRGYATVLVPEVDREGFAPDLWIERDGLGFYVEVETAYRRRKSEKWLAAWRVQGHAAIVARTEHVLGRLTKDCQACGVPGIGTDVQRLYYEPDAPLWGGGWSGVKARVDVLARLQGQVRWPLQSMR